MNLKPTSPVARALPKFTVPTVFALFALLFWTISMAPNSSRQSGQPKLDAANPATTAPRLISKVSEIDFGTIEVGEATTRRLLLTNSSLEDAEITVSSTWLSEPDALEFASDFRGPRILSAGDSIVINLEFKPQNGGHRVGALYVSHDGDTNLDIFTLTGNATLPESLEPSLGGALPAIEPSFGKSELAGFAGVKPTSLQIGPDGRLYVADMLGLIKVYEIERDGANDYRVVSEETISLIQAIPNHDDDGDLNTAITKRLVTGLLVVGTASNPIVYVASSDPRFGGGPSHTETGLDTNSGVVSRLKKDANGTWKKLDLVRGLSRSEENHNINGLALDEANQLLYLTAGGNTNQGGPSNNFAKLPEYALSAAILEINLGMIGESTYDLPTLDDETRPGTQDEDDPFGGNNGRNQAMLIPGGPVQVYAPGFRNAYDIVLTDDFRMYTIDNGPNSGWGGPPIGEGTNGTCTNQQSEPGTTFYDSLHYINARGYYGGHPNPTRANLSNTFNTSNPQSPVSVANPIECDLRGAGGASALTTFGYSTNGLTEYRASNFGGAMHGDLLASGWNNTIQRLVLNTAGTALTKKESLFANVGGLPLDVTAQSDSQYFPGTIWVADYVSKEIVVFEPVDYNGAAVGVCGGTPSSDDDNDGFSNNDEIATGTDPCSAADLPADLDGDFLSDRIDTDDDGDGISDQNDNFPRDPNNGRSTSIPMAYEWENDSESAGFLFNLGFTGLMNNGSTEYLDLYSLSNLTTGGAAGVLTIDEIPAGDPIAGVNNQAYALQFGIDVTPSTAPFTLHTRLLAPFAGASIGGYQSMGFYIGNGDQDNYIKVVTNSRGTTGSVQFAAERVGSFQQVANVAAPIFGQAEVDLFLTVYPAQGTVRAFYKSGANGEIVEVGSATSLPQAWLTADSGLAVGIISTSYGGPTFGATWDFIRITDGTTEETNSVTKAVSDATDSGTGDVHKAIDGVIAIEAEHAVEKTSVANRTWVAGSRAGARGEASMITTPDSGLIRFNKNDTPNMRYKVEFPEAGSWYVWVRGWGDNVGNEGKSDSVHVGINSSLAGAAAIQGFPASGWTWSNTTRGHGFASVQVGSAGQHIIDVWMREDGFEIDALVFTKDASYVPNSMGPAEQHSGDGAVSAPTGSGSVAGSDTGDDAVTDSGTDTSSDAGSNGSTAAGNIADTGIDAGTSAGNAGSNDTGGDAGEYSGSTVGVKGTWTTVTQNLEARTEALHVKANGSLWMFNGFDKDIDILASIEKYDIQNNVWSSVSSTRNSPGGNAAVTHMGTVMFNGELWLVGGRLGDHPGKVTDEIQIYNFDSDAWRSGPDLPAPFAAGGAAIANGRLHVFGGIDAQANCDVDSHWSLDPANPNSGWKNHQSTSPMPLARNHFSTAVIGDLIYAIGGQHSHDNCLSRPGQAQTAYVHVYDAVKDSWSRLADLPTKQSHAEPSTFAHNGQIWMVGGVVQGDRVVIYDPATNTWTERLDLKMPAKLLAPGASIVDGRLFVTGGGAPNVYSPVKSTRVIVLPDSDASDDETNTAIVNTSDGGTEDSDLHTAVNGVIAIEAEHAVENSSAANRTWIAGSRSGARGGASMITNPDSGSIRFNKNDTPNLRYKVKFPEAGTWNVWVRGWGDNVGNEGKSDSVHVGINGTLAGATAIQGFPASGWAWSNTTRGHGFATVQVGSAGQHMIDVWMREDGFEIDALVLTKNSSYVPSGMGPSEQHADDSSGNGAGSAGGTSAGSDSDTTAASDNGTTNAGNSSGADATTDTGNAGDSGGSTMSKNLVVLEAEDFSSKNASGNHSWVTGTRAGASGDSMITSPDTGVLKASNSGTPSMRYVVEFPTAGNWYVWVRGWGDNVGNEGKSDSLHVGVNGTLVGAKAMQGFPAGGWAWSNVTRGVGDAVVQVGSPGQHTIDVWMREDGLEIDALLFTTDANYAPSGLPPSVSSTGTGTGTGDSSTGTSGGTSSSVVNSGTGDGSINGIDNTAQASNTRDWVVRASSNGSTPTGRHEAGAVELDGKLYLLGGRGSRPVDIYDPVTQIWTKGAAAPMELHHFQPVALNGKIWVVGAMTCCYPREDNVSYVWTYTPATNQWTQGSLIPSARRRGSAATVVRNGMIYLVGGNTLGHDGGAVKWFDEFNPATGNWRVLPDAPVARDHSQGGLANDRLVLAAGRRSTQPNVFSNTIAQVDVYDFTTGEWNRGTDIPTTRAGSMAVTVGSEVLVIGGESSGRSTAHNEVEAYNVNTNSWRALSPLQQARHSGAAARLEDGVHVVVGATTIGGANETTSHESLSID